MSEQSIESDSDNFLTRAVDWFYTDERDLNIMLAATAALVLRGLVEIADFDVFKSNLEATRADVVALLTPDPTFYEGYFGECDEDYGLGICDTGE